MGQRVGADSFRRSPMDGVIRAMQRTGTAWQLFARLGTDGLAALLWLALVAVSLFGLQNAILQFHYPDPDDAMRLAQVRDLMAGQSWFDVNQYRVNPGEGGGLMHWSRLVDASIVSLILLLQPLLGEAAGERWALALQPLLLILPLFMLLGRILALLGGRQLIVVGLLIASTSVTFLQFFVPMRIDHHGWQLLLSVAMFWIALRPATLANGLAAAAIITLHTEISLEGLPYLAIFGGLFAYDWLRDPATSRRLAGFTLGLTVLPVAWLLAMRGVQSTLTVFCDSFSLPYVAAVAAAAAITCASIQAPAALTRSIPHRMAGLAVAAVVGGAVFFMIGRPCLSGPFGTLDPLVRHYWYDLVLEGRPIWAQQAPYAMLYLAPTLIGLSALAWAWRQSRGDTIAENWTRAAAIILASAPMSFFVTRMGATTHAFLIPAFAAMAIGLWRWGRHRRSLAGRVASTLLIFAALPGVDAALGAKLAFAVRGAPESEGQDMGKCPTVATLAALNNVPPTHLFAPIDIGPALLVRTPHSVVATGHHRNARAMHRIIAAFTAAPAAAEPIVRAERARYLVACLGLPEIQRFASEAPGGLAAQLVQGKPVGWLSRDPGLSSGTVSVYRILSVRRRPDR